jgi:multidrug resistance efflux pump
MLNLERLTLTAPFDGTIININAAIGARIDAGQTVMTLFNADSQQVRVSLPERDASDLRAARNAGAAVLASARSATTGFRWNYSKSVPRYAAVVPAQMCCFRRRRTPHWPWAAPSM